MNPAPPTMRPGSRPGRSQRSQDGLPLRRAARQKRVAHQEVPDDRAQPFCVGSDAIGVQRWDHDGRICDLCGEPAVPSDDGKDGRSLDDRASSMAATRLHRNRPVTVPAPYGEDEQPIAMVEAGTVNHLSYACSHPSSLIRAVSSDTLSEGA